MNLLYTAHVPAGDGPFPTIVALHGWGASAHDLLGLAPYLHGGEALVLCPQGPVEFSIPPGIPGYGWFRLGPDGQSDPDEVARAPEHVRQFLDAAAERYPIDRRKTVLMGFSQGGVLAYDLALRDPERFAGLVVLSAWLPGPIAEGIPASPAHANLPALVIHGTQDDLMPVARGQESRDLLLKLGIPLTYREFDMGHEVHPESLKLLVEWLEEKVFTPVLLA